jgi:iron(III) transport system permease protein
MSRGVFRRSSAYRRTLSQPADRVLTIGTAWALFALCCVSPIAWMLFSSAESGSLAMAAIGLAAERQRSLLENTLLLGAGVTAFTFAVGAPAGILLARCNPRRVWLARLVFAVPLVLPSYVLGLAWIVLFGARESSWVYSMPAAIVVLGFSLYPIVMLAAEAALRMVPARFEEAGRLVASPGRIFLRVTLPLITAAVAASLLVVFVLAISDFAVPGLLRVRVYTTEVFTAFAALYDFRLATMMALPLAALAAVASIAALTFMRRPFTGRADRGQTGRRWNDAAQRAAAAGLLLIAFAIVGVPIGAVALEARGGRAAYMDAVSVDALRNSIVWSAAGASLVVLTGAVLGYWRARAAPRVAHIAEALWVTLFAVPATIIGIGIISMWNQPGIPGGIYQTGAIVVVAYFSRFLPIAALLCGAFLRRVPAGAEEAASVSGASWTRVFIKIVLPMSRGGLAAVWLVMFILMFGDVALAILVSAPGESNLAVRAYTLIANSPTSDVARLAIVQLAVTVLPLAVIALIARKQERA